MLLIKHNKESLGKGLETHPTAFSRQHLGKLKEKIKRITHSLEMEYGIPSNRRKVDPLDILIQTILSQNTNDRNRDQAYQRLKTRFPHLEDVLRAKTGAVIQAIRPGGLAEQKARRIHHILRWIKKRNGKLSLLFLKKMGSEEIKKTLEKLKGIGPKTVHCLLLFGMGREAFPVDTHILRVGKRLGFIPEMINAEKAHQWMVPLIPKRKSLSLHLNLIQFGRSICRAKNPQCDRCFLAGECLHKRGLERYDRLEPACRQTGVKVYQHTQPPFGNVFIQL